MWVRLFTRAVLKGGGKTFATPTDRTFTGALSASWLWDLLYFKGWRLEIGGWWWLAVGGGWWLVVGGWWGLAVGGWWQLAAVGGWWLVAFGGWWRLAAVGDWSSGLSLTAVLSKKKNPALRQPTANVTFLVVVLVVVLCVHVCALLCVRGREESLY